MDADQTILSDWEDDVEQPLARRARTSSTPEAEGRSLGGESSLIATAFIDGIDKLIKKITNHSKSEISVNHSQTIVPEFNPLCDDVTKWLHAIDEYAVVYGWSDRTTCHMALTKLRGPALTWYKSLPTHIFAWEEWKQKILQQFRPRRDLHTLMLNMILFKPKSNQSLYQYAFEKLSLINKLNITLDDADKVNLIMGALTIGKLNSQLKQPEFLTLRYSFVTSGRYDRMRLRLIKQTQRQIRPKRRHRW